MRNLFAPFIFAVIMPWTSVTATTTGYDWTFNFKFTPDSMECDGNIEYHEGSLGLSCSLIENVPQNYIPGFNRPRGNSVTFTNVPKGQNPSMDIFFDGKNISEWDLQYMLGPKFSDFTGDELTEIVAAVGGGLTLFCDNFGCAANNNFANPTVSGLSQPLSQRVLAALAGRYGRPIEQWRSPYENFASPQFVSSSPVGSYASSYSFFGFPNGAFIGGFDVEGGPDGRLSVNFTSYGYSVDGYLESGRVAWSVDVPAGAIAAIPIPPTLALLPAALIGFWLISPNRRRRRPGNA